MLQHRTPGLFAIPQYCIDKIIRAAIRLSMPQVIRPAPVAYGKEGPMFFNSVHLKCRNRPLPGFYRPMYCQKCGRFYAASHTGVPCKYCQSTRVVPGNDCLKLRDRTPHPRRA